MRRAERGGANGAGRGLAGLAAHSPGGLRSAPPGFKAPRAAGGGAASAQWREEMQECARSRQHAPRARAGPGRSLPAGAARRRRRRLLRVSARRIPALRVPGPRLQSLRGPELSPLPRQDPNRIAGALCAPISVPVSLSLDFTSLFRIQVWVPCPTRFLSLAAVRLQPKPCSRLGSWPDTHSMPCPCRSKCGLRLPCPLRILSLCPVCPHPGLGPATLLA